MVAGAATRRRSTAVRHRSVVRNHQVQGATKPRTPRSSVKKQPRLTTKYASSNLKTEIVTRRENLTPAKLQNIALATSKLTKDDIAFATEIYHQGDVNANGLLTRSELMTALRSLSLDDLTTEELDDLLAFSDADGSQAIDLDEFLMLMGLLIQPPYDEQELMSAFQLLFSKCDNPQEIGREDFCSIMTSVLSLSLSPKEVVDIPVFLNAFLEDFFPHEHSTLNIQNCIEILMEPYSENMILRKSDIEFTERLLSSSVYITRPKSYN